MSTEIKRFAQDHGARKRHNQDLNPDLNPEPPVLTTTLVFFLVKGGVEIAFGRGVSMAGADLALSPTHLLAC